MIINGNLYISPVLSIYINVYFPFLSFHYWQVLECIPVGCVPAERWPYSKNRRPPENLEQAPPPKIWSRHTPPENLEQAPPPKIWSRHTPPKIWSRHPPRKFEAAPPPKIWRRHPPRKFGAGTPPLWTDTRLWKYYLGQNFVSAGNNLQLYILHFNPPSS